MPIKLLRPPCIPDHIARYLDRAKSVTDDYGRKLLARLAASKRGHHERPYPCNQVGQFAGVVEGTRLSYQRVRLKHSAFFLRLFCSGTPAGLSAPAKRCASVNRTDRDRHFKDNEIKAIWTARSC